jgi:hypothetical protein
MGSIHAPKRVMDDPGGSAELDPGETRGEGGFKLQTSSLVEIQKYSVFSIQCSVGERIRFQNGSGSEPRLSLFSLTIGSAREARKNGPKAGRCSPALGQNDLTNASENVKQ